MNSRGAFTKTGTRARKRPFPSIPRSRRQMKARKTLSLIWRG